MKVLLLSDSFEGYGAEHIMKWLGNMFCENGYNVTFCSIFDKARDEHLHKDADYYQMEFPYRLFNLHYFIGGVQFMRRMCKHEHYNYVITFHTNPFLMALLARPFCGFKIIHSERDNPFDRDTVLARFKTWLYRFADKIVFQTDGAQKYFDKKTQMNSFIIPNPISIPLSQWSGVNSKTIVSVGRLSLKYKRQDILLNAFKMVLDKYSDYMLIIYGDGPDRGKIERLINEQRIAGNVKLMGKVSNINERIAEHGFFVLSSDSEGMPNSLMEAMALGMPVISTDCEPGGAKALIDNNDDGILVERSSVKDLAHAMLQLIENKVFCEQIGRKARIKMESFSPNLVFSKWKALLSS